MQATYLPANLILRAAQIIPFYIVIASFSALGQTSTSRIYIKGGVDGWENLKKETYQYPSFEKGTITYMDGKKYKSTLNYNRFLGTLQFIDEKGDTLVIADEKSLRSATIQEDQFYFVPECARLIADNKNAMLLKRETSHQADKQKVGAFGIPNTAGTIDSYGRADGRIINMMDVNESLLVRKVIAFYLSNGEKFLPASKKNTLNLFPDAGDPLKNYLKEKNTDFSNEADLRKLIEFIGNL